MTQAPNSKELDEYLKQVVQALHGAVRLGTLHLNDSGRADQAIQDCKEILDEVMAGKTTQWLDLTED